MLDDKSILVIVKSCARCGEDHTYLEFKLFTEPMVIAEITFTHWAVCPVTKEPILMRIIDE
jgi:hypothetical protein